MTWWIAFGLLILLSQGPVFIAIAVGEPSESARVMQIVVYGAVCMFGAEWAAARHRSRVRAKNEMRTSKARGS